MFSSSNSVDTNDSSRTRRQTLKSSSGQTSSTDNDGSKDNGSGQGKPRLKEPRGSVTGEDFLNGIKDMLGTYP